MPEQLKPDFTVAQVAELFCVTLPTVYKRIHAGELKAYKVGRGTRITRESVEDLRNTLAPLIATEDNDES